MTQVSLGRRDDAAHFLRIQTTLFKDTGSFYGDCSVCASLSQRQFSNSATTVFRGILHQRKYTLTRRSYASSVSRPLSPSFSASITSILPFNATATDSNSTTTGGSSVSLSGSEMAVRENNYSTILASSTDSSGLETAGTERKPSTI